MTDAAAATPSKTEFVLARPTLSVKDVLKEAAAAGVPLTSPYVYKIRVRAGQGKRAAKKAAAATQAPKAPAKRGRKPKAAAAAAPAASAAAPKAPAKRGRPKKVVAAAPAKDTAKVEAPKAPAKRGRPKKVAAAAPANDAAASLRRIVIELGVARTRAIVDEIAAKLQAILAGK